MIVQYPFYSIIIPTHNQSAFITDAIKSSINQSFTDFELIISDDSTDELTKQIVLKNSDKRIRYHHNILSLGRTGNYKHCINNLARGKWVIICDGDDFYTDSNYLNDVADLINKIPDLVMIQAGHLKGKDLTNAALCVPEMEGDSLLLDKFEYLEYYRKHPFFSHMSTVGRLDYLKQIDPYRLPILSSDTETYLRLARFGKVILLKRSVGLWRQHSDNATLKAGITDSLVNLDWIRSVANDWEKYNDGIIKQKARQWGKEYTRFWVQTLYERLLKSESTSKSDVIKFIWLCLNRRYFISLLTNKKNLLKLVNYFKTP